MDEIVKKFVEYEDENYSLFKYVYTLHDGINYTGLYKNILI